MRVRIIKGTEIISINDAKELYPTCVRVTSIAMAVDGVLEIRVEDLPDYKAGIQVIKE